MVPDSLVFILGLVILAAAVLAAGTGIYHLFINPKAPMRRRYGGPPTSNRAVIVITSVISLPLGIFLFLMGSEFIATAVLSSQAIANNCIEQHEVIVQEKDGSGYVDYHTSCGVFRNNSRVELYDTQAYSFVYKKEFSLYPWLIPTRNFVIKVTRVSTGVSAA